MGAIDAIRASHERDQQIEALETEISRLRLLNSYLMEAVELLSLPRVTVEDLRIVRDGLLLLTLPMEKVQ